MNSSDPGEIVDQLQARYAEATSALRAALAAYLEDARPPDMQARLDGAFAYPELRVTAPHGAR
ncbi:MAG: AMP nucleosidase, partial [Pseudomonadota bacterium]|nr:AMP nucleosidase [Pseudomonadota bacterium]